MNLFGLFQISGSALTAERLRAEVVTSNLANAETTRTPEGGPYRRRMVVFRASRRRSSACCWPDSLGGSGQPAGGVRVNQVVDDPRPAAPL